MTPKGRPARRHHVVSKFYLKGFADDQGQIVRVPLGATADAHPISITNATVQKDFYRVDREGTEPDAFESALSDVEDEAAPAFRRLVDEQVWPISDEDRTRIAAWVALQYLRTSAIRRSGEEIHRSFSKLEIGVFTAAQIRERLNLPADTPDEEVERIRANLLASVDTFEVDHHGHLSAIAEMLPGATNLVFFRQPWLVTRFQRKALGTSDTPLVLIPNPADRDASIGAGFGTAMQLYIPLSRRVALAMGELSSPEDDLQSYLIPGNASYARQLNQYTLWNARRVAFHHPGDRPFEGLDIPDPSETELNVPGINDMIEAVARQHGRPSGLPKTAIG
jgi:hypothetical protein